MSLLTAWHLHGVIENAVTSAAVPILAGVNNFVQTSVSQMSRPTYKCASLQEYLSLAHVTRTLKSGEEALKTRTQTQGKREAKQKRNRRKHKR